MIRIEPDQWLPQTYAKALSLVDVLRHPAADYETMTSIEKDSLRQSQIEADEVVRILGFYNAHALVMKSDQVLGWLSVSSLAVDTTLTAFVLPQSAQLSVEVFFQQWQNTPYIWGGITRHGVDCSGLTQRYFLDVLNQRIPKNTYDQRRAGISKTLAGITNNDLVFCTRIGGRGIHHVGIYINSDIWHAHGERGVIRQTLDEFITQYQLLDVVKIDV